MNQKLAHALEAIEQLPADAQNEIADAMLQAATHAQINTLIEEAGEASYQSDGGRPIAEVFGRLTAKYAS